MAGGTSAKKTGPGVETQSSRLNEETFTTEGNKLGFIRTSRTGKRKSITAPEIIRTTGSGKRKSVSEPEPRETTRPRMSQQGASDPKKMPPGTGPSNPGPAAAASSGKGSSLGPAKGGPSKLSRIQNTFRPSKLDSKTNEAGQTNKTQQLDQILGTMADADKDVGSSGGCGGGDEDAGPIDESRILSLIHI